MVVEADGAERVVADVDPGEGGELVEDGQLKVVLIVAVNGEGLDGGEVELVNEELKVTGKQRPLDAEVRWLDVVEPVPFDGRFLNKRNAFVVNLDNELGAVLVCVAHQPQVMAEGAISRKGVLLLRLFV